MVNRKSLEQIKPRNILVRMPNWIGDAVMATPVLADLSRHFPEAKITAMCQGAVAQLFTEDPHVDEVYKFTRPSGWLHRQEHRELVEQLRRGEYDLGLLLTNSFSSAWWFWRGKVRPSIGYSLHCRRWLLDCPVPPIPKEEKVHQVVQYKRLLERLGIPLSDTRPRLYVSQEEQEAAKEILRRQGVKEGHVVIGINPGAAYGSAKCWLPSRFRQVTQHLLENPLTRVVYFGDQAGSALVRDICVGLPDRVVSLAGATSLRELIALIHQCDIFLTNDSGPMHIASALGTPLVALFGSTCDLKTGPYNGGTVINKRVECSPCFKRQCPIDFRCMKRIEVDEVYQALQDLLRRSQMSGV